MSALAAWALLVGLVAVPLVLLGVGARMHRRPPPVQSAFRGASAGFLLALVVVVTLLVVGPYRWPPAAIRLWGVALALPVFTLLGAALGRALHRRPPATGGGSRG